MVFTLEFVGLFLRGIFWISPILISLCFLISMLGLIVGRTEGWTPFNSVYWAFITALTVGYGDIKPSQKKCKLLAVLIALLGVMFTGIFVAVTVTTATIAFESHYDQSVIEKSFQQDQ